MPSGLLDQLNNRPAQIGVGVIVAVFVGAGAAVLFRRRKSPEEAERLRRNAIQESGRVATGLVSEFQSDTVYFTYTVRGIEYSAAQDISHLRDRLPQVDDHMMIGPCSVKYRVDNPANSMVVCEDWNGLRPARGAAQGQ